MNKSELLSKQAHDTLNKVKEQDNQSVISLIRNNFEVLNQIVYLSKGGKQSAGDIVADILNECGITKRNGEPITSTYALKILSRVRNEKPNVN